MAKHMDNKASNQTKYKSNKKSNNIIFLICIIIFIYSTFNIVVWIKSNIRLKNQKEELEKEVISIQQTEEGEKEAIIDFDKLTQINSDVVGWIEIPNTNINYPILQGKDNEYYLKKDIYKKYNSGGSIFLDYQNNPNFTDDNTVIYGHNLHLGQMFSDLQKILKEELGTDILIKVYFKNQEKQYKVFSSYLSEPIKNPINTNITDKKTFIEKIIKDSQIDFNIMPNEQDEILTLSTCDRTGKKRIIVHAVGILTETINQEGEI